MDGLMVSELARRSGVPATTLRFYEQEGLLPARRSRSGYRLYDVTAVDRLAFIGTAKRLGLPLPEIRRLLGPWEHGVCAQVQLELDPLLDRRLTETHQRIDELWLFAARLERARAQLGEIDRDGPCDPDCAFLGRAGSEAGSVLRALPRPATEAEPGGGAVIACSLTGKGRLEQAKRWQALLADVTLREAIPGGLRLRFDPDRVRVGELAELAVTEAECCAFFDLSLHLGPTPILEVRAPAEALALVHELFGDADEVDA